MEHFLYLYTAASLGHPRARSQYSTIYLQNGLIPDQKSLEDAITYKPQGKSTYSSKRGNFQYLRYISPSIMELVNDKGTLSEVQYMKQMVQSQSVLQLYLASQQKIYKNLSKEDLLDIEKHKLINIKPTHEVLTNEDMQDYK